LRFPDRIAPFSPARHGHPGRVGPTPACCGHPAGSARHATGSPRSHPATTSAAGASTWWANRTQGHIFPGTAGFQHVQDAVEGPTFVGPRPTRSRLLLGE
jgi:hypothetical protein